VVSSTVVVKCVACFFASTLPTRAFPSYTPCIRTPKKPWLWLYPKVWLSVLLIVGPKCHLVSHIEYADGTDRRTVVRLLQYAFRYGWGQRNNPRVFQHVTERSQERAPKDTLPTWSLFWPLVTYSLPTLTFGVRSDLRRSEQLTPSRNATFSASENASTRATLYNIGLVHEFHAHLSSASC